MGNNDQLDESEDDLPEQVTVKPKATKSKKVIKPSAREQIQMLRAATSPAGMESEHIGKKRKAVVDVAEDEFKYVTVASCILPSR